MVLKRQIGVIVATLVGALGLLVFSPSVRSLPAEGVADRGPGGEPYAAGELLVTYREEASARSLASLARESGAEVEKELPEIDARLLEFPEVKSKTSREARERQLEQIKNRLKSDPAVEDVEYNYVHTAFYTPNDPRFRQQWGLKKAGFPDAWKRTSGRGVRVAVVDSGAAIRHVDLRRKVVAKYDFRNNNRTVEDLNGHGTHVAGIVAARTGNRTGVAGGCPGCRLIVAKAIGKELTGYTSDIARAIIWSANKGARVINLSFGSTARSDTRKRAVNYAARKGAVVVGAGGNYGTSERVYPAAYRNAIAVAYTGPRDRRDSDSSYGRWIDVAAPGVNIVSTVPGGGYRSHTGSSQAAPHVSALAGLLASQGRGPRGIRLRILRTALDLGARGDDRYYGHGRIRAGIATRR